jgi:hypothetical protein
MPACQAKMCCYPSCRCDVSLGVSKSADAPRCVLCGGTGRIGLDSRSEGLTAPDCEAHRNDHHTTEEKV